MFTQLNTIIGAAAGVVITLVLCLIVNVLILLPNARTDGEQTYIAKQAVADRKVELERKNDDAKINVLSDYDLCVAALQPRGLSVNCDQLL